MPLERWEYEEFQGQVRGLIIMIDHKLPPTTVAIVNDLIDHNESGVALEIVSEMLAETDAWLSTEELGAIEVLVRRMHMDDINVDRLRPHVDDVKAAQYRTI